MRKLLLATVAVLGASVGVASIADAQTASPAPGTVTVRLNGRFRFYGLYASDQEANNNAVGPVPGGATATGAVGANGQGALTGTNKLAQYGFVDYIRLYPGFDGVAANGLKYGASIEIRQDQSSGAGSGQFGSISQTTRARGGLYVRREWGYLGTDQLGTVRLGSTDDPSSLYITGTFENFNSGGFNGDLSDAVIASPLQLTWPFADVSSLYATEKAIYLSPQLYGFDFGVSYEPSTAAVGGDESGCGAGSAVGVNFVNPAGTFVPANGANGQGVAGPGCDRLSSTPINQETGRRKNTLDALIRYRGSFGGFGIAATASWIRSSNVKDNQAGIPFNSNRALPGAGGIRDQFEGLDVGDFGLAVTYAGFSIGGNAQYGRYNGSWGLSVPGVPSSVAYILGASYTIGPVIVGAQYLHYDSPGDLGNAILGRARQEQGVAYGGTYSLAPGVSIFFEGSWEQRKQNGYNFITGQGVSATAPGGNLFSNKVSSNLVALGTSFSW